jgi:GNAT superfamily N-acetyltransferase
MDNEYRIELTEAPDPDDLRVIREGLDAHNAAQGAVVDWVPLALLLRDEQGAVVGGLTGGTYWGWLYVGRLWIQADLRGQGYGSQLLEEAEQEAMRRNCHHVYLDTQDFHAPSFYQKRGYTVYGEVADMPLGHSRYSLQKKLE